MLLCKLCSFLQQMNTDILGKATKYAKGLQCSYTAAEVSVYPTPKQVSLGVERQRARTNTEEEDRMKVVSSERPDTFI